MATKTETSHSFPEGSSGIEIPVGVVRLGCAQNLPAGTVSTVMAGGLELIY